jgi:hypothetical protein
MRDIKVDYTLANALNENEKHQSRVCTFVYIQVSKIYTEMDWTFLKNK